MPGRATPAGSRTDGAGPAVAFSPMIVEQAVISVRPGSHQEFEEALARAHAVISASPGFRTLRLHRGIESPDRYLLLVEWETLEDHTVGFRESDRFTEWRSLIGPFFEGAPEVEHFDPVVDLR